MQSEREKKEDFPDLKNLAKELIDYFWFECSRRLELTLRRVLNDSLYEIKNWTQRTIEYILWKRKKLIKIKEKKVRNYNYASQFNILCAHGLAGCINNDMKEEIQRKFNEIIEKLDTSFFNEHIALGKWNHENAFSYRSFLNRFK
jgi:hypothetical protein